MGTYATSTTLQTIMPEISFSVTGMTALVDRLITHAENEVNKYMSKRYDVADWSTTTAIPPLVTTWTETLAAGYLYQNMSRGGSESMKRGQTYIDRVLKNMTEVADGVFDLISPTGGTVTQSSTKTAKFVQSSTSGYANTFNEDDPLNWAVDDDKLDDIASERE